MTSLTVAIPTRNRPDELRRALQSVMEQSSPPQEVLVVDDSDANTREATEQAVAEPAPGATILRKGKAGLTRSRNLAADRARSDLITYLDDDVVLDPGYLAAVRACFLDPEVGGAGGIVVNQPGFRHPSIARALWAGGGDEGKVLSSGWATGLPVTDADTQFLSGCNMTYRTELVRQGRFDEVVFSGYGLGEDIEFSHRVFSNGHRLRIAGAARLRHFSDEKPTNEAWGRHEVLICPLVAGPAFSLLTFSVAALARCFSSLSSGERPRAIGNIKGLGEVWLHR